MKTVLVEYNDATKVFPALEAIDPDGRLNLTIGDGQFKMELPNETARKFYNSIQTRNKHVRKKMEKEKGFDYLISV